jgi:carboxypeptidase D
MGVFPQYAQNDVVFATESYGGHYGPVFSEYIMKQNEAHIPGAVNISLSALLIGNGWFDPMLQYPAYLNFTVSSGNSYDLRIFNSSTERKISDAIYRPGGCIDALKKCYTNGTNSNCATADDQCYRDAQAPFGDVLQPRDAYDMRYLDPSPFPPSYFVKYLNTPKVQKAIGAYVNFTTSSSTVGDTFTETGDDARVLTVNDDLRSLVKRGVTVALYFGDSDYIW